MRDFFYSLMSDRETRPVFNGLKGLLYVISLAYGAAVAIRSLLYRFNIFKTHEAYMTVISVGNITLGGTGKTPFVIMLSRILKDNLLREVSVLIRGYGWDEQTMLKNRLPDIPVLVGEDRTRSARRAVKLYGSDTVVLDDGFQYWELARDLDIVLIDSRNPFGNGYLFPRGVLREESHSLKRSKIIVLTKVREGLGQTIETLKSKIKEINPSALLVGATHKPKYLYDIKTRRVLDLVHAYEKKAILISSIGDPDYFTETAQAIGVKVVEHIKFGDHHNYDQADIRRITARCDERQFDILLTTEKDSVKLARLGLSIGDYPLTVLVIEMEIISGKDEFIAGLRSLYTG